MAISKDLVDKIVSEILQSLPESRVEHDPALVVAGVSNRHVHLSRKDGDRLFGSGHELTPIKDLRQPGQFACKETVTLGTSGGVLESVRVLGPYRKATQVEISASDARRLRIKAPLVKSGADLPCDPVTLIGPAGSITVEGGVGIAWRHLHLTPPRAAELSLKNGQEVSVEVQGDRGIVFNRVWVRVGDSMEVEFHVDVDEANSCGLSTGDMVRVLGS